MKTSLAFARFLGYLGYYILPKKRAVIYANLKTVFCREKSPAWCRALSRRVFVHLTQSFVELMCFPVIQRAGFKTYVNVKGQEHVKSALGKGKGVILLAIHSGNWELGNVINGLLGTAYHVIVKDQPKVEGINQLLAEARQTSGAQLILTGGATKDIIRLLKRNEMVGLVFDQGGEDGLAVDFCGKSSSMATGAVRLAMKYGCALCPVWISRREDGCHAMEYHSPIYLEDLAQDEDLVTRHIQMLAKFYERLLKVYPDEYLWMYKVFKYTKDVSVVILDDGNQDHLNVSKKRADELDLEIQRSGKNMRQVVCPVKFKRPSWLLLFMRPGVHEDMLRFFLTSSSYKRLMAVKADIVISCGEQLSGVNRIISREHMAKSIQLVPVIKGKTH